MSVYLEKDRKTVNPLDRKTFLDTDQSDGGSSGSIEDVIIKVSDWLLVVRKDIKY